MRYVNDPLEIVKIDGYMQMAAEFANNSECKKSHRGVIIVNDGDFLGIGYNKQLIPENCNPCIRENDHNNDSLRHCGEIHAEQMAIRDALASGFVSELAGSTMYHIKTKDGLWVPSGKPSCVICGADMVYNGIKDFVLLQEIDGKRVYVIYATDEYNKRSHGLIK